MKGQSLKTFLNGIWRDHPIFSMVLGICSALAVSNKVENAIAMGAGVTFVLLATGLLISALRTLIPSRVRMITYMVVIATFVIVVELMMQAYAYALFEQMGIFIPLIVVNCILLGRAEAFASKNGVVASCADGLGMGIGFTISLVILASIRELLGNGTWYKIPVFGPTFEPFGFMVTAPGAFVCLGLMLCIMNLLGKK